jgi:uridine kinase
MELADRLATAVTGLSRRHDRVVVGIDGPDCAGKTTLAGRLEDALENRALRVCADRFSRPRAQRYQRGELSPDGYYHDSFDYPALRGELLLPFLGGQFSVRTSGAGYEGDPGTNLTRTVPTRAVLVVDGVFLLRPELRGLWTISVYLRVSAQESLRRAHGRDLELFGSPRRLQRGYLRRYLPGQELYRRSCDPEGLADVLVDNERTDMARIERWTVPGGQGR